MTDETRYDVYWRDGGDSGQVFDGDGSGLTLHDLREAIEIAADGPVVFTDEEAAKGIEIALHAAYYVDGEFQAERYELRPHRLSVWELEAVIDAALEDHSDPRYGIEYEASPQEVFFSTTGEELAMYWHQLPEGPYAAAAEVSAALATLADYYEQSVADDKAADDE